MGGSQKVVVAVLAVVTVLFVVAVGVRPSLSEEAASGLLGRLGGDVGTVPRDALSASCLEGDTLTFQVGCGIRVAASDEPMRVLKLLPSQRIGVESRLPREDFTVEGDANADKELVVAVDERETVIALRCPGIGTVCVVRLAAD